MEPNKEKIKPKSFEFSSLELGIIFLQKHPSEAEWTFQYTGKKKDLVKFLEGLKDRDLNNFILAEEKDNEQK